MPPTRKVLPNALCVQTKLSERREDWRGQESTRWQGEHRPSAGRRAEHCQLGTRKGPRKGGRQGGLARGGRNEHQHRSGGWAPARSPRHPQTQPAGRGSASRGSPRLSDPYPCPGGPSGDSQGAGHAGPPAPTDLLSPRAMRTWRSGRDGRTHTVSVVGQLWQPLDPL